jgi:hypothetical protein
MLLTNPMHTVDFIDEISRDKVVPAGALGYAALDILPQKVAAWHCLALRCAGRPPPLRLLLVLPLECRGPARFGRCCCTLEHLCSASP